MSHAIRFFFISGRKSKGGGGDYFSFAIFYVHLYMPTNFVATEKGTDFANGIMIFPNPATSQLNISLAIEEKENGKLYIYDMMGKIVKESDFLKKESSISVAELPKGIYFLHVSAPEKLYIKRFVIE